MSKLNCVAASRTIINFTQSQYQLGQVVEVMAVYTKRWGVITGMNYEFDYQQWKYWIVLFISKREGFDATAYEYSEQEVNNV